MARKIRAVRRGLGKGKGKGYKNIMGKDPKVHSMSAKGMKQPQRIKEYMLMDRFAEENKPKRKYPNINLTQQEIVAVDSYLSNDFSEIDTFNEDENGVYRIETKSGEEFFLFKNEERAEEYARAYVREMLEDEPETFNKNFLREFIYISDTDKRLIAQDESDNYVEDMEDEDVLEETGFEDKYDDAKTESQKEKVLESARDELSGRKRDEIYGELKDDPLNYFTFETGIYSEEELLKQPFIQIDVDEASKEAINIDGWEHFIGTYDGKSNKIPKTKLMIVRLN